MTKQGPAATKSLCNSQANPDTACLYTDPDLLHHKHGLPAQHDYTDVLVVQPDWPNIKDCRQRPAATAVQCRRCLGFCPSSCLRCISCCFTASRNRLAPSGNCPMGSTLQGCSPMPCIAACCWRIMNSCCCWWYMCMAAACCWCMKAAWCMCGGPILAGGRCAGAMYCGCISTGAAKAGCMVAACG